MPRVPGNAPAPWYLRYQPMSAMSLGHSATTPDGIVVAAILVLCAVIGIGCFWWAYLTGVFDE